MSSSPSRRFYSFGALVLFCANCVLAGPDDCALPFTGSYRAAIKQRRAGLPYQKYNHSHPIDLAQWFTLTEQLGTKLGTKGSSIPRTQIIKGVEDIQVTLKGYLLAVRFEENQHPKDGKDNEFHIEIGATPQWQGPHVIVEVTTGTPSCEARKEAWKLAVADYVADRSRKNKLTFLRVFANPPQVIVKGYIFIDGTHAHGVMTPQKWAHDSGGRGISIKVKHLTSQVQGLFEVHPVTALDEFKG
jgi:hypothetical protein